MTESKAKVLTLILVLTGILMPVASMFFIMKTEVIWLTALLGIAEIVFGAVICANLANSQPEDDEGEQESYL